MRDSGFAEGIHKVNDAIFAKLSAPSERDAADALNAWTRRKMRGLTRRGLPERSIFLRIMPPIPTRDGVPTPPWETGALIHEIVESLELRAEREAKMTARELWYRLAHVQRRDRRHPDPTATGYDKYHFGMRVAASVLSQIRNLGERSDAQHVPLPG